LIYKIFIIVAGFTLSGCSIVSPLLRKNRPLVGTTAAASSPLFLPPLAVDKPVFSGDYGTKPIRATFSSAAAPTVSQIVPVRPAAVSYTASQIETATAVQLKYAVLLDTDVEQLPSSGLLVREVAADLELIVLLLPCKCWMAAADLNYLVPPSNSMPIVSPLRWNRWSAAICSFMPQGEEEFLMWASIWVMENLRMHRSAMGLWSVIFQTLITKSDLSLPGVFPRLLLINKFIAALRRSFFGAKQLLP
jgi:hypothetical protein